MPAEFTWKSHLGVYAVIIKHSKILVIKKSRGPYTGLFDLPGGSLEAGELLEETLVREIKEETACKVTSYQQIPTVSFVYPYTLENKAYKLRHIAILYTAEIEGTPTADPDGHDSNGCLWINTSQLNAKNASGLLLEALR